MAPKHSVINLRNMHRTLPAEYGVVFKINKKELFEYARQAEHNAMRGFIGSMIYNSPTIETSHQSINLLKIILR